tara:strand:+ start:66 stop:206 length:141 start_codon:yes stop_codon:yes gene_type:complete
MGFIKWHKGLTEKFMGRLGVDWYAVAWISWFKGVLTGLIIYHFLLM